jgi:hypothetical protein
MRKERTEYDSPVDALVSIAKRLSGYESHYRLTSEEFFDSFSRGQMEDSLDFTEWANLYQHCLALREIIEKHLRHVA